MKKLGLVAVVITALFASANYGFSAELNATTQTVATPPNNQNGNGTIVGINPDGTLVLVDNTTGSILIVNAAGLTAKLSIGDEVNFIFIITPNGNMIIQTINKGGKR